MGTPEQLSSSKTQQVIPGERRRGRSARALTAENQSIVTWRGSRRLQVPCRRLGSAATARDQKGLSAGESGDSPSRREAGAREQGGRGGRRGRGAGGGGRGRRGVGGAWEEGSCGQAPPMRLFFRELLPKLSRLPPRQIGGREEGVSGRPEIGGRDWQRCPLRTALRAARAAAAAPGAAPAAAAASSAPASRLLPASPALRPPARTLAPAPEPGRTGSRREPAGGARAPEPRAPDPSPQGAQLAPPSLEGGHRPRSADLSGAGVSPPPHALGASSLSRGNPPLTGMPRHPCSRRGAPVLPREQKVGFRGAMPPLLAPRGLSFGKERPTGRRGVGEAQLFTFSFASLWRGYDGGLAGWADRGVQIRAPCSCVCASRPPGGQRQKRQDTEGRLINALRP